MAAIFYVLEVTATNPKELEHQLSLAEKDAMALATEVGAHGILITRHGAASFCIEITDAVPYGLTLERSHW